MTRARDTANALDTFRNRNLIINGAMQVAQRGDVTGKTGDDSYGGPDRYSLRISNIGTWSISQSPTAPDGFANSYKADCTTADASLAANDRLMFVYRFEGQDVQQLQYGTSSAKNVTLSFWVRSNKTGTYVVELFNHDPTPDRHIGATYSISSADTWEYKTLTFTGDTAQGFDNDNGRSFDINWYLGVGSTYTGGTLPSSYANLVNANRAAGQTVNLADSTSNEWYITGVQLEVGSTATPFEHRSYGDELRGCQRYYLQQAIDIQTPIGGYMIVPIYFPTTMRAAPATSAVAAGSTAGGFVSEGIGGLHTQGAYYQVQSSANSNYRLGRIDAYSAEI